MSNMSYCRFENTYQDLQECFEHFWDDGLSDSEQEYREWLIKLCKQIAYDFEDEE